MKINFNGKARYLPPDVVFLDYATLAEMAGHHRDKILTVMYSTPRFVGSLKKGESVAAIDGMVFNVADTGNA